MEDTERVICVDLDGTLIKNDVSNEAAKAFIKRNILNVFRLVVWYFKGIQYLKYKVAEEIEIDPSALPYNFQLLSYLSERKRDGSRLYLATGATEKYANQIAEYLKVFDGVFASDKHVNLIRNKKAEKLSKIFGREGGFAYAGNSLDDLPVWEKSSKRILVDPTPSVLKAMQGVRCMTFSPEN